MMEFKWIECDDCEITMMQMPLKNGSGTLPMFVFVERDPGNRVLQETFKRIGFRQFVDGVWITNKFIDMAARKLNMRDLVKFLQQEQFKPKVTTITREKIEKTYQDALVRSKTISQAKRNSFSQIDSKYLGENLNEEDVYQNEKGERFIREGKNIVYSADEPDAQRRYLTGGTVDNGQITIDADFAAQLVQKKIANQTESWIVDDTLSTVGLVLNYDGDLLDLQNIEDVINDIHAQINRDIIENIDAALAEEEDKVRNTRNAINAYAGILPLFNQGDETIEPVDSPLLGLAMREFSKQNIPLVRVSDVNNMPALFTGNESKVALIIQAPSVEIEFDERQMLEQLQDSHSITGMFEVARVSNSAADIAHRVILINKDASSKKAIPPTVKATRSITETMSIVDAFIKADAPLPFSRDELSDAIEEKEAAETIKTLPYESLSTIGSEPNQYVVPAALQGPLMAAKQNLTDRVGDLAEYVAEKLQLSLGELDEMFSKAQIDTIAMTIAEHEGGGSNIMGNGTGTGKTRVIAAMLRYRALRNEPTFFATVDKELFNNLFKELRVIKSQHLIKPLVASDEPLLDEDDKMLVLPDGSTSDDHLQRFKEMVKNGEYISADINLVMCSYHMFNKRPVMVNESGEVVKSKKKDENVTRQHDSTVMVNEYLSRNDSLGVFDESHYASGNSNTGNNIKALLQSATNILYSSATYAKNHKKMAIYGPALPEGLSGSELEYMLAKGGLDVVEGFTMKMASTGKFITYQMPTDDVQYYNRTDDANLAQYKQQNNEFASIITSMKALTDDINSALEMRKAGILEVIDKTVANEDIKKSIETSFGFRVINGFSRFTKLNELKVVSEKAKFVSDLAIEALKNNQKPWIPTELTSETNLKYAADRMNAPVFSDADILDGKHIEWLDDQEKNGNPVGVSVTVGDALHRSLHQMLSINVPTLITVNESGKVKQEKRLMDARDFIEQELGEGRLANFLIKITETEALIEKMTPINASPIDEIKLNIEAAGFKVGEYSGRRMEMRIDDKGRRFLAKRSTLNSSIREGYQLGETDAVLVTKSGFTGKEWHSEKTKDERQRVAFRTLPVSSSDLEKQLAGRLVRTGMANPPVFMDVTTGLLPEKRLYMQADYRRRSLDAGTSADANFNFKDGEVYLFSEIGNEAAIRYFMNNPQYFDAVGMSNEDIQRSFGSQSSFAMVVTARLQLLDCDTGEDIMRGIEREYFRVIEEMESKGIKPFGDQTLYWDAKVEDKILISGDENSADPWNAPVYAARMVYEATDPVYSSADVSSSILNARKGLLKRMVELKNGKESIANSSGELTGVARAALEFAERANYYNRIVGDGGSSYYTKREEAFRQMLELTENCNVGDVVELDGYDGNKKKGVIVGASVEPKDNSVSLKLMVPGETMLANISEQNITTINPVSLGMQFDVKSRLASQFDNQTATRRHSRMVFMGDSFLMQKQGMDGKSSYLQGFSPRIMSVTTADDAGKKQVEKVVLLPTSINMHDIIARPVPLKGSQAYNYMQAIKQGKKLPTLDSSMDYSRGKDVRLSYMGLKDNKEIYKLTVARKAYSKVIDDEKICSMDINGDAFPEKGGSIAASMFVEEYMLPSLLDQLQEYDVKFLSHAHGGQWVEAYKNGTHPADYKQWLADQEDGALELFRQNRSAHEQVAQAAAAQTITP